MYRLRTDGRYRQKDSVVPQGAVCCKVGLPKKRDEPWFLMMDLGGKVERWTELDGKHMTVEELYRADKNQRNDWSLRHTKLKQAERLDRLLLMLALAHWLRVGLGRVARQRDRPSRWCRSNRAKECRVFTIG